MFDTIIARARSLWRGVRRRQRVDDDMRDEFRLHVELRTEDLVRGGLSPHEAARRARIEFGSPDHYTDVGADSRGLRRFDDLRVSWLDFKLGLRMLGRYPGLTVVGGIAMAFGVAVGVTGFEWISKLLYPTLPFDGGNRIVAIQLWDAAANRSESRLLHDFEVWRNELRTVEDIGAFRTLDRNLIATSGGRGDPVIVAEMSASGFALTGVKPLLGRTIAASDEYSGAAPVAVIGADVWRARFAGDPNVLGRSVQLGAATFTVVGVMPDGFRFPAFHSVWTPLRLRASDYPEGAGPAIARVFARVRPGATIDDVAREVVTITERRAAASPQTHARLRPQVLEYAKSFFRLNNLEFWGISSINLLLLMLMILVCGNVALLMFARASSREAEIVVRTALGASRTRIVTQLFTEALVLGGLALVVGLAVAQPVTRTAMRILDSEAGGRWPFWFSGQMSSEAVLYAVVLTLLGAAVAGVLPAVKVTHGIDRRLRQAAAGTTAPRFGGVWTVLIVAQIAVTVAFPVTAFFTRRDAVQIETYDPGLPAREYLTAQVSMDREVAPGSGVDTSIAGYRARFRATTTELQRRLASSANVAGVTFVSALPGTNHPLREVEIEGVARSADSTNGPIVSTASVALSYLNVVSAPVVVGRSFVAADLTSGANPIVVNQSFVREVLHGQNAVGVRVRYISRDSTRGSWAEIVGVVRDLGMTHGGNPRVTGAGIYHVVEPRPTPPMFVVIRVKGDPAAFAPTLRGIATALDPTLRLDNVLALDAIHDSGLRGTAFWVFGLVVVSGIALLLSLASIYSVMAFAVARRTREIGVRIALGSSRRRVLATIFARPLRQVVIGVAVGSILVAVLASLVLEGLTVRETAVVAVYAIAMFFVCLLACVVPTRRAIAIEPTEALRADG